MSALEDNLERRRSEAEAARARLNGTLLNLQQRLKPAALLDEAVGELREKASELAQEGVEFARARPLAVAGVGAAAAAYAFRAPLWRALVGAYDRLRATDTPASEFQVQDQSTHIGAPLAPVATENER